MFGIEVKSERKVVLKIRAQAALYSGAGPSCSCDKLCQYGIRFCLFPWPVAQRPLFSLHIPPCTPLLLPPSLSVHRSNRPAP